MQETTSSTIARLTRAIDNCPRLTHGMRLYLFGSALKEPISRGDMDVLLVYPSEQLDRAHQLATILRGLELWPPVEVLALSDEEEREANFIGQEGAQLLWEGPSFTTGGLD